MFTGGLDDTLSGIISSCEELQIPVVFALRRQLLGRVLLKKVPVSIVGIFNYDGAQVSRVASQTAQVRQSLTGYMYFPSTPPPPVPTPKCCLKSLAITRPVYSRTEFRF